MSQFDVAILGAGNAGVAAALQAADLGGKVCLVDPELPGGHYIHQGLFPIRSLMADPGFFDPNKDNSANVLDRMRTLSLKAAEELKVKLDDMEIEFVRGTGAVVGRGLRVEGKEGPHDIAAKHIILATGSHARTIPTLPFDDHDIFPLDRFSSLLADPPSSLMIFGNGVNAIETAVFLTRLGIRIFLCDPEQRLIPDQDPELINALDKSIKGLKVKTLLNKNILSILKTGDQIDITLDGGIKFSVEKILVGRERVGRLENTGISELGLEQGEHGDIWVNEDMQTSQKGVFAAGSLTGHDHSVDRSQEEGRVAGANAMGKEKRLDPDQIPFRLHTQLEMAAVGCRAEEAHHKGFRAVEGDYRESTLDPDTGEEVTNGFCRLVADRESRKIVGAQLLGKGAGDTLSLILLAMQRGTTVKTLAQISAGFGGGSRAVVEAARICLKGLSPKR